MTQITTIIKFNAADTAGVVGQQPFKAKAKFDKTSNWILKDKLNQIKTFQTTIPNDEFAQANIQIERSIFLPFLTPFYGVICGRAETPSLMIVDVCEKAFHLTRKVFTNDGEKKLNYTDDKWMDPLWLHRRKCLVLKTKVADEIKDFPLLINIPSNTSFANNAQADGDDFVITQKDGVTIIPHEIEKYDTTTGELVIWAKVPKVSDTSNFQFYIYYDNAAASNQQDIVNVWKNCYTVDSATTLTTFGYNMVQHLHSSSLDSTENNNDGTDTSISYVTGKIADAASFDALNSKIDCASGATIDDLYAANGWLTMWIDLTSDGEGSVGEIIGKGSWRVIAQDQDTAGNVRLRFENEWDAAATTAQWDTAVDIPILAPFRLDIEYDDSSAANNPTIYINGVARTVDLTTLTETTAPGTTADSDAGNNLIIGNNTGQTATTDGELEEIRFMKVPPADIIHIIKTQYAMENANSDVIFLTDHEEYKKAANLIAGDIIASANADTTMPQVWSLDVDFPTDVVTAAFPYKNHFDALHVLGEILGKDVWFDNRSFIVYMGTKGKVVTEPLDITITSTPEISVDNFSNEINIIGKRDGDSGIQITDNVSSLTTLRFDYEKTVANNQLTDVTQLTAVATTLLNEFNKLTPTIKGEVPLTQFNRSNLQTGDTFPIYQPDKQIQGNFRIMEINASPSSVKLSLESTDTGIVRLRSVSLTGVIEAILRKIQNQSIES